MPGRRCIQVILPLRLEWEPCYYCSTPAQEPAETAGAGTASFPAIGARVQVKFAGRSYVGVVSAVDVSPGLDPSRIETVTRLDTGLPPVSPEEISLWRFIAEYYLCTVGEVYKAAYPAQKTASEQVRLEAERRRAVMQEKQVELWKARIAKLSARLEARDRALEGKHSEAVTARLQAERAKTAAELEQASARLASFSGELFAGGAADGAFHAAAPKADCPPELAAALASAKPVLFMSAERIGTYVTLARQSLGRGRNVLLLVPEINLVKSLECRMRECFGDLLLVHHSEETPAARRRIADSLRSGRPYILLGTRSSIFLPFSSLGLIIIDGEQSVFYKQSDSSPRYNGRDAAIMLGKIHGAAVLLGTSSPSLETLLNYRSGKYSRLVLPASEPGKAAPAGTEGSFQIIDTRAEHRKNGMNGCFSRKLADACRRSAKTVLIRGFEREEDVLEQLRSLQFEGEVTLLTIPQAARTELSGYSLAVMLSADALFRSDDFRSDERAFQFLDALRRSCPDVLIQTANPGHQVFTMNSAGELLEERRRFSLPPYTRLADVIISAGKRDADIPHLLFARLLGLGFNAGGPILRQDGKSVIRLSFPRDAHLKENKKALYDAVKAFCTEHHIQGGVAMDVDPA